MTDLRDAAAPSGHREGGNADQPGGLSTSIPSGLTWDEYAAHVDGTFVVVVRVTGGRFRRRCFLTVAAAQKCARRATERGENAVVILAELRPVYRVIGGGPHG